MRALDADGREVQPASRGDSPIPLSDVIRPRFGDFRHVLDRAIEIARKR
jgi:hypothetical protein